MYPALLIIKPFTMTLSKELIQLFKVYDTDTLQDYIYDEEKDSSHIQIRPFNQREDEKFVNAWNISSGISINEDPGLIENEDSELKDISALNQLLTDDKSQALFGFLNKKHSFFLEIYLATPKQEPYSKKIDIAIRIVFRFAPELINKKKQKELIVQACLDFLFRIYVVDQVYFNYPTDIFFPELSFNHYNTTTKVIAKQKVLHIYSRE